MQIDYALQIPNSAAYNTTGPTYTINNSANITPGSFSRIGYFLELETSGGSLQYMYVSLDASPFCTSAGSLGIPIAPGGVLNAGPTFHYGQTGIGSVQNMDVVTNVAGIAGLSYSGSGIGMGTKISTGNAQFWGTNYQQANAYNVPNASSGGTNRGYDWGDQNTAGNYGTLQLANYGASQCLISIDNFGGNGGNICVGIGNDPNTANGVNYTFENNAANYTIKNLIVLVGNPNTWSGNSSSNWGTAANWAAGTVPGSGQSITFGAIAGGPSAAAVDLGSSGHTINGLTFLNSVPSVTISSSGGQTLTFDNGASLFQASVLGNHAINTAVALNSTAAITIGGGSSLTFGGPISDGTSSNGIALSGGGTLILSASNGYSGGTTINGGLLMLSGSGSLASSATVSSGGSFATSSQTPALPSISVAGGGALLPGWGSLGATSTLSVGTLYLQGTAGARSIINFKFNPAGGNDLLAVTAANGLTINTAGVNLYALNGSAPFTGNGTFDLMSYSGAIQGTGVSGLSVLNGLSNQMYTFGTSNGYLTLSVTGAPSWNGGSTSTSNWSDAANWQNGVPNSSSMAVFDGTVRLNANNDIPNAAFAGLRFNNGAGAFTLSGGSVTLSGNVQNFSPNTQTVNLPIVMSGGSQTIVAQGGPIVTTALGTINNGGNLLAISGASNVTLNGAVSGSGGLTVIGPGGLTLASSLNTYSGNTRIAGGALTVGNSLALQNTMVDMNSADAGSLNFDSLSAATLGGLMGTRGINLGNAMVSVGALNLSSTYSGSLSGVGGLTKIGSGVLALSGSSFYTGNTVVSSGTLVLGGGLAANAKIMPVGDSITDGVAGTNAGYRGFLYSDLTAAGYNTFQFVGNTNDNPGSLPASPVNQQYHNGWSGQTTAYILNGVLPVSSGGKGWLTTNNAGTLPNIITMMIGTNDAAQGVLLTTATSNIAQIINTTFSQDPGVRFLLGECTPRTDNSTLNAWLNTYNADLITIATQDQALGDNIGIVDLNTNFPTTTGLSGDGLHPNDTGYTWMAQQWYNAIAGSGVGGGTVLPSTSTVVMSGGYLEVFNSQTIGPLSGSSGTVNIENAQTLTVNSVINSTYSGLLRGGASGALTKVGLNSLTLAGTCTYGGTTTINAGTLVITPATSLSGSVSVNAGGYLAGRGTIPLGTVASGGHIVPGAPNPQYGSSLFVGSTLNLQSGSNVDILVAGDSTAASTDNNMLMVSGSNGLTIANGAVLNLYGSNGTTPFNPNGSTDFFDLIGFSGTIQGAGLYGLTVGDKLPNTRYIFSLDGPNTIALTVGPLPVWNGLGGSPNWSNSGNWNNIAILPGDQLVFGSSTGTTTVNDFPAGTLFNGMQFNSGAGAFTLSGNSLALIGNITNSSASTQTIALPMAMGGAGGRTITAAAGPIVTTGAATINNGGMTLSTAGTAAITLGGAISGSGGLLVQGPGVTTLTSSNSFTGNTRIAAGTLTVGHPLALQATTVDLNPADVGTLSFGSQAAATLGGLTGSRGANLGAAAVTIGANNSSTVYTGILTGGAGLTKTGSGTLTVGSAQYYNGPTTINGGMLTLGAVPAGAAAIYLFDNSSGTASGSIVYNDATSGLANKNATLVNGATIAVGGGQNGANALSINYSTNPNAQMQINQTTINGSTKGIDLSGGAWTGSVWFNGLYLDSTTNNWATLFHDSGSNASWPVIVQNNSGEALGTIPSGGGGGYLSSGYSMNAVATGWHQLTVVGSGGKTQFYIDGSPVGNLISGQSLSDIFSVGGSSDVNTNQPFARLIDNVYLYQQALTAGQVQQLYAATGGVGSGAGASFLPANSPVNITSGTLNIQAPTTIGPLSGAGAVNLGSSLTINGIANTSYAGLIGGAAGLTKAGSNTLTLTGTTTYTGLTTVNAGGLSLGAAVSLPGNVQINVGGLLSGSGTAAGTVTVAAGGQVAPGVAAPGSALTVGGLSLVSGSIFDFKVASGATANDSLVDTGSGLTIPAGVGLNLFAANGTSQFNPNGTTTTLDLINYSGTLQGAGIYGLSVLNKLPNTRYIFAASSGSVTLTVGTQPVWNGGGSGNNWSAAGNWNGVGILPGDQLIFDGGTNTSTNNNQIAGLAFNGITFNPTAGSFTLGGNGVTLTNDIVNNSPSTQTINLPMVMGGYGGRTINAAAGPIATTASGTIDNGGNMLTVTGSAAVTLAGAISDTGGLTVAGPGTTTLSAANTFSGNTRISTGTLAVGNALALQNSTVDMNQADAGTLSFGSQTSATLGGLMGVRNLNLGNAMVSIGNNNSNTTFSGALSGASGVVKIGTGQFTLTGQNSYGGGTTVSQGTLVSAPTLVANNPLGTGTITLNGGTIRFAGLSNGQQPLSVSGFTGDDIAEASASTPGVGTNAEYYGWWWYENGATASTQGLPNWAATGGVLTSSYTQSNGGHTVFQLQPYGSTSGTTTTHPNNVANVAVNNSLTMPINNPVPFSALQILYSGNGGGNYNLTLNFADSSTYTFSANPYLDWTNNTATNPFAYHNAGLVNSAAGWTSFYTNPLSLFENDFTVPAADLSKTLTSVTFTPTSGNGMQIFALAGNINSATSNVYSNPVNVTANSTIDLEATGSNTVQVGNLSVSGANTLSITGSTSGTLLVAGLNGPAGSQIALGGNVLTINGTGTSSFAGAISGGGSLVQVGAGITTLTGTTSYTGSTSVSAGTLLVNSPSLAGAATVSGNGTLSGTAAFSSITVGSGGQLIGASPNPVANLSTGTLNLQGGTLDFRFTSFSWNDYFTVTGNNGLTIGSSLVDLYQNGTSFSGSGTYNLISYAGALQGSASGLYIGNRVPGTRYTFGTTASEVTLTIAPGPVWSGAVNGTFSGANWGGVTLQANDNLAFAGGVNTTVTNDTAAGTSYAGMAFLPGAGAFTVGGNAVTMTDDIVNNSTNSQTVNLPMTMAGFGGRTINAAAGPIVTGAFGTIANGGNTLTVVGSSNTTMGGAVNGSGGLTMAGPGVLALNASNTYTGTTSINGGTVQVNYDYNLGSGGAVGLQRRRAADRFQRHHLRAADHHERRRRDVQHQWLGIHAQWNHFRRRRPGGCQQRHFDHRWGRELLRRRHGRPERRYA